ncbi:MAG: hypothetical protein DCF27_09505 [Lysobacteraceae bacterium]|nr:MAG: hypothetical protein DCF27_09505 [Xanthomonadaceae bacterium]
MAVTRTIGPLHFEDLEPKRFEDLTRQLIYDFKDWQRLEATGRAGSDDGFDARGYEVRPPEDSAEDRDPIDPSGTGEHRLWLVQCKRERTIGPTKLAGYFSDTKLGIGEKLHGIIFVAACDFSKRARDAFRRSCEEAGIEEWYLWGKAELEDLLFQPRHDALLFAYFGISLTIRRRSAKAVISSRLAIKRRANNVLSQRQNADLLIIDSSEQDYPYSTNRSASKPNWFLAQYHGLHPHGLRFVVQRHFAYLSDDKSEWDAALAQNDAGPRRDPWSEDENDHQLRSETHDYWSGLPKQNQAWFEVVGVIPFERILGIDEMGDNIVQEPHVYAEFSGKHGPFMGHMISVKVGNHSSRSEIQPKSLTDRRVSKFPAELRAPVKLAPYGPIRFFRS